MKCPGQDSRYWKPGDVFETPCPECGAEVEFFKDDPTRRCRHCGRQVLNPNMDFGCASYCQYAEQCIGSLPPELIDMRKGRLQERLAMGAGSRFKDASTGKDEEQEKGFNSPIRGSEEKAMNVRRKIIHIDEDLCDGCGACVPSCAEGAIEIVDGKARMVAEKYCDGLGACLGECPKGALSIEDRVAEEFDEKAVEAHLSAKEGKETVQNPGLSRGCPSSQIRTFVPDSALSHWPVQIKLVPPTAPFLRGAHLLVAADCAPVAYSDFHRDFLKGKAVMIGCPKFDDVQEYVEKFAEIFKTADIKSVTVVDMEVPCCSALPRIVKSGMDRAGKSIPVEEIVISTEGTILKR